jgi:hypothetical protein
VPLRRTGYPGCGEPSEQVLDVHGPTSCLTAQLSCSPRAVVSRSNADSHICEGRSALPRRPRKPKRPANSFEQWSPLTSRGRSGGVLQLWAHPLGLAVGERRLEGEGKISHAKGKLPASLRSQGGPSFRKSV